MTPIVSIHQQAPQRSPGAEAARSKKQVLERRKPGLKPGQKIRAARKFKPAQIEAIVRFIKGHALDNPETPLTYTELAEEFETSVVTLRSKAPVKAAMEETRAAASAIREARKSEQETPDEAEINAEQALKKLKEEMAQLKQEVANYRKDHQLLTLYFHMRGESLTQVLTQASASMSGELPRRNSGEGTQKTTINPISRR